MEDKRTIHTYKAYDKTYEKAMKICKRRKQYLSNIIESVVDALAEDKTVITHGSLDEERIDMGILSQKLNKKIKQ